MRAAREHAGARREGAAIGHGGCQQTVTVHLDNTIIIDQLPLLSDQHRRSRLLSDQTRSDLSLCDHKGKGAGAWPIAETCVRAGGRAGVGVRAWVGACVRVRARMRVCNIMHQASRVRAHGVHPIEGRRQVRG